MRISSLSLLIFECIIAKATISLLFPLKKDIFFDFLVVTQNYDCYVNQAHVIRGNDVLMKCDIPSFVTDFVTLQNWQDNEENIISPYSSNGTFKRIFVKKSIIISILNFLWFCTCCI